MSNLGDLIKKAREEKGYSQRKLARLSYINNTEISKIESGDRKTPNFIVLKSICRNLDITYEDCLYTMGLGATYNPNNKILMNYYKNINSNELKNAYESINWKINECDAIMTELKKQFEISCNEYSLLDTIKSYEYENRTNKAIKEILEERILNEYLKT